MKTAILFKCHDWNADVERQLARLKRHTTIGDLFILFDRTRGIDSIPQDVLARETFFFVSNDELAIYGLEWGMADRGGFWYCGDYSNSLFIIRYPDYDFVVSVESDVAVFRNIDDIVLDMQRDRIDLVYLPVEIPIERWSHAEGCHGYYDMDSYIHKGLFCISFFSRRALLRIYVARLEMAHTRKAKSLYGWPIGECVMVEEVVRSNMRVRDISMYCDTLESYDWAPSFVEAQLAKIEGKTFVHPVAGLDKYVRTNFHQNYKGFTDGARIRNGEYKPAARAISNLQVYCELYWSSKIQNDPGLKNEIYMECLSGLKQDAVREQLAGDNIAFGAQVRNAAESIWKSDNPVLQQLPLVNASYEIGELDNPWLEVDLRSLRKIEAVIVFLDASSDFAQDLVLISHVDSDDEGAVFSGRLLNNRSVIRFDSIGDCSLLRLSCPRRANLRIKHFRVVEAHFGGG